jgi:aspartyl/asparaginyl-tRNA synthetase
VWGKRAEAVGALDAGAFVCFEGKLRQRQKADQTWEMVVSGYEVVPMTASAPTLTGNAN